MPQTAAAPLTPSASVLEDEGCYRALQARDARFDGRFFTAVTSTGVYCRPVCKVRTPKRDNCRFFALAAQAEAAGFRPCLRCRPELAPASRSEPVWSTQDASHILAQEAARWLSRPVVEGDAPSMATVAARLGVSERHLRRIFQAAFGVSPQNFQRTHQLLCAKQLLTDTTLPMADVAALSGFASLRTFNAALQAHYRLTPSQVRATGNAAQATLSLRLYYRPPYDVERVLAFLAQRAIPGVEVVDTTARTVTRTLRLVHGTTGLSGWIACRFDTTEPCVQLQVAPALVAALPQVLALVRAWLDLDADPQAIGTALAATWPDAAGVRIPGAMDGFELAVRAVLGQQITVAAAHTLAKRLVLACGGPVDTPHAALTHRFPTPTELLALSDDALGALGIVRQRQKALRALAQACADGSLPLHPGAPVASTMAALQALPGIGPWTANYIAMRALRWPDAFVAGDVALHNALGLRQHTHPAQAAEAVAEQWRPWRSYGVVRAWQSLAKQ
ncbi:AlkA N-terminal domain-containing protein [Curvibacter sp. APW13]|uniref:DNA-3-methyladenine glycosylase 2 family protein n=1 Tax=Curvibacter sp. APW13 TaxID=3077236 RepID=UPI0028DFD408|nr:AlkA N-terminal domain-containing protein [Curvibacter sp. APW13]MDT8990963.1 AlkA N-terminal domain-containing protein [Curvibacter sp. APW13]